jgi:16S rRNA (guanine527-N7)-methyltransferase
VWERHFADSAQLWRYRPPGATRWLDLGSGAGFPGLVIAILAADQEPELRVTLVESDQRKAAFLRAAAAATGAPVKVIARRAEDLDPLAADVLSARALAPLGALMHHAEKHRRPSGICLFPKGTTVHKEIEATERIWRFDHELHASLTNPAAAILEIGAMGRV